MAEYSENAAAAPAPASSPHRRRRRGEGERELAVGPSAMELSPSRGGSGEVGRSPEDIAIALACRLQVRLPLLPPSLSLSRCQLRSWRRACDADCVWEALFGAAGRPPRRRWRRQGKELPVSRWVKGMPCVYPQLNFHLNSLLE
ncbi:hypothetical protein GUJ93_ZPchr0010g11281 [Zizania palustris]|uniref:Uncharacterized protein n=1 Tax=Zizania palustris TaxID=103762 RepID=A0A8J6BH76_ZIZPA|nr:hypothetical protein GUJ93_ZPchr0010g11281 [Zizania palustris]